MPPAPRGATISYGPSFVPEVRVTRGRNYSPIRTSHRVVTVLGGGSANHKLSRNGLVGTRENFGSSAVREMIGGAGRNRTLCALLESVSYRFFNRQEWNERQE